MPEADLHRPDTKLIPLTQGKFAIVDAEDYDRLSRNKWQAQYRFGTFYAKRSVRRSTHYMRREIMRPPASLFCDHKNHDGLDNRKSNLRLCTRAENIRNQRPQKGRSSRYKGVCRVQGKYKWWAQIRFDGKIRHLGMFDSQPDAAVAYDRKAKELLGGFACLNFPQLAEFRYWLKKLIWAA